MQNVPCTVGSGVPVSQGVRVTGVPGRAFLSRCPRGARDQLRSHIQLPGLRAERDVTELDAAAAGPRRNLGRF